jgi:hypothetical protein
MSRSEQWKGGNDQFQCTGKKTRKGGREGSRISIMDVATEESMRCGFVAVVVDVSFTTHFIG